MDETAFPELRDEITVYGVTWCPDCRQSRAVFEETLTPYVWVDIDKSKKGEKFVLNTSPRQPQRADDSFSRWVNPGGTGGT